MMTTQEKLLYHQIHPLKLLTGAPASSRSTFFGILLGFFVIVFAWFGIRSLKDADPTLTSGRCFPHLQHF
jgi:hypothetical protein